MNLKMSLKYYLSQNPLGDSALEHPAKPMPPHSNSFHFIPMLLLPQNLPR
jgi:hypothetical protein